MRKITDPWEVSKDKPLPTLEGAVQFLKNWFDQKTASESEDEPAGPMLEVLKRMIERDPQDWCTGLHFGWGMTMRNLLRENGYGEQELGVGNLDDYYVALIEEAVLGQGKNIRKYPTEEKS